MITRVVRRHHLRPPNKCKSMKINRILTGLLLVATLSCSDNSSVAQEYQQQISVVVNPEIPRQIEFAGQTISFDRYDMYERLDRELTSMMYTHGTTLLLIKRANKYFPILAPILKKHGVPMDFLYLACIESTLDIRAYSPAKAAGLWQFIPSTAKEYGLEIRNDKTPRGKSADSCVDERYHIEKETDAACRYFKKAYAKYGNWETVMASYNAGQAGISRRLESQQVSSAFDLHLVTETSRYVFRIMAAKLIMENPQKYGFSIKRDQLYFPVECKTVKVTGAVDDWADWAKSQGITYAQLRENNPWIRSDKLSNPAGKTYEIKVPLKESMSRSTQGKKVFNENWVVD